MPITIQGVDAVPWFHRPAGGVLERLEWKTEVFPSFNGKEQRRALRLSPRRFYELDNVFDGAERRIAEVRLSASQAALWALPVWMDAAPLAAAVSAGAVTINVDTTTRDYRVGSYVGIATSGTVFETALISAVASGSLTVGALASGWPAGAIVFPVRGVRMDSRQPLQRFTGDASYGRFRWECTETSDYTAASETLYRSIPVLGTPPNWTDDIDISWERRIDRVGGDTGLSFYDDETGGTEYVQSHRWLLDGRAQIDAFRQFLYARRGRAQHFWLPTFAQDFELMATISSGATTIDVGHTNYVANIAQAINRRDIRIELVDGTVFMRRINSSTVVNATTERLTVDSAIGATITAAQVKAISFMALVRLDTDGVDLAWQYFDRVQAAVTTRSSRNDL